jgi:hypothetical protein
MITQTIRDEEKPISDEKADEYGDMIERISTKIVDSKMESVAVFLLESFRPMSSLWTQLLRLYVGPFLMIFGPEKIEKLFKFLEKPENLEYFISRIEEKSSKVDSKRS